MKVSEDVFQIWNETLEHGDIQKIIDESGISQFTISSAIKEGECSEKTFTAINDFIAKKRARIEESVATIKKQEVSK